MAKYPHSNTGSQNGKSNKRIKYGKRPAGSNPITRVNLYAAEGGWVYEKTKKPYIGAFHVHMDGTAMIGSGEIGDNHPVNPDEVIIRAIDWQRSINRSKRRRYMNGSTKPIKNISSRAPQPNPIKGTDGVRGTAYRKGGKVARRK